MEKALRVKPVFWSIEIGVPIILLALVSMVVWIVFGELTLQLVLTSAFLASALMHIIFLTRMKNPAHLIPIMFYFTAAATFLSIPTKSQFLTGSFALLAIFFFALFMWVIKSRAMKWRYREVLEMAARSVRSTKDGYTDRPFVGDKLSMPSNESKNFAGFLKKKAIAWPLVEGGRLILVVPENYLVYILGMKKKYQDATFVSIDNEGRTSVKIAEKDYRRYQDEFTFDQLCTALLNLFAEFWQLYQVGDKAKITRRMDDLKFLV